MTPIKGMITANDCGTGKTVTFFLLQYNFYLECKRRRCDDPDAVINAHPLLLLCPAPLVYQHASELVKRFGGLQLGLTPDPRRDASMGANISRYTSRRTLAASQQHPKDLAEEGGRGRQKRRSYSDYSSGPIGRIAATAMTAPCVSRVGVPRFLPSGPVIAATAAMALRFFGSGLVFAATATTAPWVTGSSPVVVPAPRRLGVLVLTSDLGSIPHRPTCRYSTGFGRRRSREHTRPPSGLGLGLANSIRYHPSES